MGLSVGAWFIGLTSCGVIVAGGDASAHHMLQGNDMTTKFEQLVQATADQRRRVRQLVAQGQWKQAEPDAERFRRFAAKRLQSAFRGAEAIQGNTQDFQPASFLSAGARVRRAVAYVEASFGSLSTTGSGFMISPRLFITNQHVIPHVTAALGATITFDRELDEDGRPRPVTTFELDPHTLALFSDEDKLDYAVIAVGRRLSGTGTLDDFGHCPLSAAPDKHVVGMAMNIIQHPLGQRKLISIRHNLLVARTDATLLYETDTQVGSSGAPVFNDDWEVVALHHHGAPFLRQLDEAGQPVPQEVNEGIRASALVNDWRQRLPDLAPLPGQLLAQALALGAPSAMDATSGPRLGPPHAGGSPSLTPAAEAIKVDADYSHRTGFDEHFLPGAVVGLPRLSEALKQQLAPLRSTEPAAQEGELKYEHFSIKLHRTRRMAIYTATNIDGATYLTVDRATGAVQASEGDRWFKDPRVSEGFTLTQDFYSAWSTYFDRGHLTRRADPTWGTEASARRANADTFHFTNCSPQHFRFNQSAAFWQGIERYVLESGVLAPGAHSPLCVFQGPIFDDAIDRWADDVQIPSAFFKVVVWMGKDRLRAVGLVADQSALLDEARVNLGAAQTTASPDVRQWRVAIPVIEQRTGLDLGADIREADTIRQRTPPVVGAESQAGILIRSLSDIDLGA